jgi:hypothetical protein
MSVSLLLFGLLTVPRLSLAQSATTGSIAGVVKDVTGAVLPGVTVEAASPALIEKVRTVITDDKGEYKIVDLRPGAFTVTFTLAGFSIVKREGIELTTGFTATVNAQLAVGALTETVTVAGASPVVDIQNVRSQKAYSKEAVDTLPTAKGVSGFAALTPGVIVSGSLQDVGGNRSDQYGFMHVHGGHDGDGRQLYDGMWINDAQGNGGGVSRHMTPDENSVQETTLETGGMSAESSTGGVHTNYVPRDGGNTFSLYLNGTGVGSGLQNSNINSALESRGVTQANQIKKVWDIGGGLGGPILHDRLWFYTAHRWWGAQEYIPRAYVNATPHTFTYTPNLNEQGFTDYPFRDNHLRLTWQATSKNKITLTYFNQDDCQCHYFLESGAYTPEATIDARYKPVYFAQATWSYPATNKLLFQAGFTRADEIETNLPQAGVLPTDISWIELTTGVQHNSMSQYSAGILGPGNYLNNLDLGQENGRLSMTYVTGSHAFKAGMFAMHGVNNLAYLYVNQNVSYGFRNGIPAQLSEWASPGSGGLNTLDLNLGLYAQDQWTVRRVTLNLGLRYDQLKGSYPAQTRPGGPFVGPITFPGRSDLPNFKDLSPRLGIAYDLFGNGRTAIKATLGRYVVSNATDIAGAINPANAIVVSTTRTWTDANGNFIPDCDLQNPAANGECGAINNNLFGTVHTVTQWASDATSGFGKRGYTWEGSALIQHELRPGTAVNVAYYRTWFGNFTVTQNTAAPASAFSPYCVTAPVDARLPGGGGNAVCGFFDVNPAQFGQVSNIVSLASNFGNQTEVFNGFDFLINSRFGKEGLLQGGLATGQTVTDNCYANARPDLTPAGYVAGSPRTQAFCHVAPPWSEGTQVKLSVIYPLPWDIKISATYQNLPGLNSLGTYVATNAQIAPSLGRNLAAGANGTATVGLVPTGVLYEDRLNQVDLRFVKIVKIARARLQGRFDIYNLFNASTILNEVTRYGPQWLQPSQILGGRVFKFGAQLDY